MHQHIFGKVSTRRRERLRNCVALDILSEGMQYTRCCNNMQTHVQAEVLLHILVHVDREYLTFESLTFCDKFS